MPAPPVLGTLESSLYARDPVAAERFYAGTFGLAVVARQKGRHVFFRVGGSILPVLNPEATATGPRPGANLPARAHGASGPGDDCLAVEEAALDAWRAHLLAEGIVIAADFRWPNGARSLHVLDPAGNSVELADPASGRDAAPSAAA